MLNYRVGAQPGWPLYVPDTLNNKGPQRREPFKCLNGRNYGERLAPDHQDLDASYKRLCSG